jgi:hypothetical protein
MTAISIVPGRAEGPVLAADQPLSFWGGVDPATGRVIDVQHPLAGQTLGGKVLVLPGTRGSCSGSGVVLDLILSGRGPAALIFTGPEEVATLGVLVAAELFGRSIPVLRLPDGVSASRIGIAEGTLTADDRTFALVPLASPDPRLSPADRAMLSGAEGPPRAAALRLILAMARLEGAGDLTDVTRAHIDGCIYASPANLTFAERFQALGARVRVPTTMNAISVDHAGWRGQGTPASFGEPAQRLADAYVAMGAQPSFTCAPYLLPDPPAPGEVIAWSESNAVIHANSVLGARTAKLPDFLDLCAALTGRAPRSGAYLDAGRLARRVIAIDLPDGIDDAFWPLLGYVAGGLAPDRIPLLTGLGPARPGPEALKALCAAFGTSSAAPMLHIEGVTPEAMPGSDAAAPDADHLPLTRRALRDGWDRLNRGGEAVDLVAIGSPHASAEEARALAAALAGRRPCVPVILTLGRAVLADLAQDGALAQLTGAGVRLIPDLCWCSITEPVFPPATRNVMTNSGKYAHYGPGLSGRSFRFGPLAACAEAAVTGHAPRALPPWLRD